MKDARKTKKQLIAELAEMRRRVAQLEDVRTPGERPDNALSETTWHLQERTKELNCLYGISGLVGKQGVSLREVLQGTVEPIPSAWQYPEITCARGTGLTKCWRPRTKTFTKASMR